MSNDNHYEHGKLSQAEVEPAVVEVYDWRRHADDPDSYWIDSHEAADLLGVSRQRLGQLGDKGSMPFVRHRDGYGCIGVNSC